MSTPTIDFRILEGDTLEPEHAAIAAWVREATESQGSRYWTDVDLKSVPSGRTLLNSDSDKGRRLLLAALAELRHWDDIIAQLRAKQPSDLERANLHRNPEWRPVWTRREHTLTVLTALLRRSLPLERGDIDALLSRTLTVSSLLLEPIGPLVKAVQRYIATNGPDPGFLEKLRKLAVLLRASGEMHTKRLGTVVEQLCGELNATGEPNEHDEQVVGPIPQASPAGSPAVLLDLKHQLGIANPGTDVTREIGPDHFTLSEGSPLEKEHALLSQLLNETLASRGYAQDMTTFPTGQTMLLEFDSKQRAAVFLAATERHMAAVLRPAADAGDPAVWRTRYALDGIARILAASVPEFDRDSLFDCILYLSCRAGNGRVTDQLDAALLDAVEEMTHREEQLTEGERYVLHLWRCARIGGPPLGTGTPDIDRLTRWIGDGRRFHLVPGEHWSDAVNDDLGGLAATSRTPWVDFLMHLLTATGSRPSDRWRKTASALLERIGPKEVRAKMCRWLPLVAKGGSVSVVPQFPGDTRGSADSIHDENANVLRGLLWTIPGLTSPQELAGLVAGVALSAYRKVPGVGPRAVKVGNAAVYSLSQMVSPETLGQLAMLKVRVRFGTAQKEIEKAFDAAAAQLELPRDQIEELSVPACGLESVGFREEVFGDYRAHLVVTGSNAELKWFDLQRKQLKAVPINIKRDHAEDLKDLQRDAKDLQAMLSAQRERIDSLFLERKNWALGVWRERYVDHPLVGTIGRRLIWCLNEIPVTMVDGIACDIRGDRVQTADADTVTLWHPAGRDVDEVVAWRRRIEDLGMVQPFKQAHREIYLLTDAERRTETYSNRFAAHILRQHQFNALCGARRWKNKLRLLVDDEYPPAARELPAWNLRAEFWIEGIGADFGVDTNDSGTFLRLASDQVRFYRIGAAANRAHAGGGGYASRARGPSQEDINEPLPLEEVPVLAFSEVMRDIDLFVGVASVGNDPTWQDGGPGGRYREYWHSYSFGELAASALSRREALQRLIPRLKIADRCTLSDRFLVVRGNRRTYKIHLGSGNILMEPNDQYLCIVPDSRAHEGSDRVYLPFEGDGTLSIILSKAFLLAADDKIKDVTINRQIDGR